MQLKYKIFLLLTCLSLSLKAQNSRNEVYSGGVEIFQKSIYEAILSFKEELPSKNGFLFVRFNIGKKGIKNIQFSDINTEVLNNVLIEVLLKTDRQIFKKRINSRDIYILPIDYRFNNVGNTSDMKEQLSKAPTIDLNAPIKIPKISPSILNFSGLPNFLGLRCILLETIFIRGPYY